MRLTCVAARSGSSVSSHAVDRSHGEQKIQDGKLRLCVRSSLTPQHYGKRLWHSHRLGCCAMQTGCSGRNGDAHSHKPENHPARITVLPKFLVAKRLERIQPFQFTIYHVSSSSNSSKPLTNGSHHRTRRTPIHHPNTSPPERYRTDHSFPHRRRLRSRAGHVPPKCLGTSVRILDLARSP